MNNSVGVYKNVDLENLKNRVCNQDLIDKRVSISWVKHIIVEYGITYGSHDNKI